MNSKILLAALVLALGGCASRWLDPVRVVSADADTIRVEWSSVEVSQAAARRKAVQHCSPRRVQEVEAQRTGSTLGLVRSRTWRCVSP